MTWGAVAVAGAAVVGGVIASNSASSAANKQADSSKAALGEQQREFDINQQNYAPYLAAGKNALGQLQTGINTPITSADVMADPGYQFGLNQGMTALDRKIAAMGGRVSGAALKQADRYATDYATSGWNAAYQRGQDRLNRLASLAGIGQTATNGSALAGQSSANAISNLISGQGNASAAATMAQGNIWGNTVNQLGGIYQNYANRTPAAPAPAVGFGSDSNGYNGTQNNPSAYVGGG